MVIGQYRVAWIGVVVALALACGCTPDQEESQRALPDHIPTVVDHWNNGTVNHVEFIQKFQITDYEKVLVLPADTSSVTLPPKDDNTYGPVTAVLAKTTEVFSQSLQDQLKGLIAVQTGATDAAGAGKTLNVRIRVLEMDPGSQAARYWVGFGAGHAHTAIEGDIVDSKTGQSVLRFKDDDYGSGGIFGGDYNHLLTDEVQTIAGNLGTLLEAFTPPVKK